MMIMKCRRKWDKKPDLSFNQVQIDWPAIQLVPFTRDLFQPTDTYCQRHPQEIEAYRKANAITVSPSDAPTPIFSFNECSIPQDILSKLQQNGIVAPTPIQAQGIPIAMKGMNMVGIAQTGSGKTLAYLLPAAAQVANQKPLEEGEGPIALVLAPTRELALQIQEVIKEYFPHLRSACIYGGASKNNQVQELVKGVEIIVATPGRLLDVLRDEATNLKRTTFAVLDEADRMLDIGFEPQIRAVLRQVRPDRQMLMWSATWPQSVQRLAQDFLNDYIRTNIGSEDLAANHSITQVIDVCGEEEKLPKLLHLLRELQADRVENKTIVFAGTKGRVNKTTKALTAQGYKAMPLHGKKVQSVREQTLDDFRRGVVFPLVATDVAGRGLDVDDIKFVINYDFPQNTEDYVHRIGRTGRSGRTGTAFTFFTKKNAKHARDLIKILEEANQEVNPRLRNMR